MTDALMAAENAPREPRPWRRALLWLICLGILFYLSYGFANWLATQRAHVPSIVFGWERHIPFIAWTIIPYWSVNAFYACSVFVCATRRELRTHVRRLLTAQVIAVAFFLATPLVFTFAQPDSSGLPGMLFAALNSFDRPYNQAPSLHIALLVILWALYVKHTPRVLRPLLHLWFTLIGVSVLTTYQHHFFDIPTGALLGLLCLWAWPQQRTSPLAAARFTRDPARQKIGAAYLVAAGALSTIGIGLGGWWLWLLYPAVSLTLVACNYLLLGPGGFQKDANGRMSTAARLLLAPYLALAWLNSRLWTRGQAPTCRVDGNVWIGRFPDRQTLRTGTFDQVIDLTAELPAPGINPGWRSFPMLDLVAIDSYGLQAAAHAIEHAQKRGSVLVVCALGYTRSAAAVALWLLHSGRADGVDAAIEQVSAARPQVHLARRRDDLIAAATLARPVSTQPGVTE